jgi:hypothetical protein
VISAIDMGFDVEGAERMAGKSFGRFEVAAA